MSSDVSHNRSTYNILIVDRASLHKVFPSIPKQYPKEPNLSHIECERRVVEYLCHQGYISLNPNISIVGEVSVLRRIILKQLGSYLNRTKSWYRESDRRVICILY